MTEAEKEIIANKHEILDLQWQVYELKRQIGTVRAEKMRKRNNKRGCKTQCKRFEDQGYICPLEEQCPYHELDNIKPTGKQSSKTGYEIWCDHELAGGTRSDALMSALMFAPRPVQTYWEGGYTT